MIKSFKVHGATSEHIHYTGSSHVRWVLNLNQTKTYKNCWTKPSSTCSFNFRETFTVQFISHARMKDLSKKTQNIPLLMEKPYPNRHCYLYPH